LKFEPPSRSPGLQGISPEIDDSGQETTCTNADLSGAAHLNRIEVIRASLAAGTYRIDSEQLAGALMESLSQVPGEGSSGRIQQPDSKAPRDV